MKQAKKACPVFFHSIPAKCARTETSCCLFFQKPFVVAPTGEIGNPHEHTWNKPKLLTLHTDKDNARHISVFVAKMRHVQVKTQSKHKASAKTLVMRLFKDPLDDPKLCYVKDSVLSVKDSKPIVARSDPTMTELFELPALIVHGEFARIHIFPPRLSLIHI